MLMPSMIIPPVAVVGGPIVLHNFEGADNGNDPAHTYAGVPLGVGDIYVVVLAATNGSGVNTDSVTVAGLPCVQIAEIGTESSAGIFKLAGNVAVSGDVVITSGSFFLGSSIDVYLVNGATEGTLKTGTATALNAVDLSMNIDAGSTLIGGVVQEFNVPVTFNWTNAIGDTDIDTIPLTNESSLFQQNVTAGSPKQISVSVSAGGNNQNIAAVILELK